MIKDKEKNLAEPTPREEGPSPAARRLVVGYKVKPSHK